MDSSNDIAHAAFYFADSKAKIFISSISVIREYEGKGVGSLLLDLVEHYAIKHQVSVIELEYDCRSTKLTEFYNKKGFKKYTEKNVFFKKVI